MDFDNDSSRFSADIYKGLEPISREHVYYQMNGKLALGRVEGFLSWPGEGKVEEWREFKENGFSTDTAEYLPTLEEIVVEDNEDVNREMRCGTLLCVKVENFADDPDLPKTILKQTVNSTGGRMGMSDSITIITQGGETIVIKSPSKGETDVDTYKRLNFLLVDLTKGVNKYFELKDSISQ